MPRFAGVTTGRFRISSARRFLTDGKATLVISGEEGASFFSGAIYGKIGCLLKSTDQWQDLRSALLEQFGLAEINAALQQLADLGLFASVPPSLHPMIDAYWEGARALLPPAASIAIRSFVPAVDLSLSRALTANGLLLDPDSPQCLGVTDDYLHPEIAALAASLPELLLTKPLGHTIWIGPLFMKDETVCFSCLSYWIAANRWAQNAIGGTYLEPFWQPPLLAALPSTLALGVSLAATTVANWLARGDAPELRNTILLFDTRNLSFTQHRIRPAPGCKCAERFVPGELSDLNSAVCGIVSRLKSETFGSTGVNCATGQLAPPLPRYSSRPPIRPLVVSGRGFTRDNAEKSCIGEGVERYSTIFQGSELRITATLDELQERAIDPAHLFLFSDNQYECRDERNRRQSRLALVPMRLRSDAPIEWTEVVFEPGQVTRYAPTAYCYLWYPAQPTIYQADSNGCAAGPDIESAAVSAMFELVERDALSIWWDHKLVRSVWDIDRLNSPELIACRDALHQAGRELRIIDIGTDIEISACVAVAARKDGSEPYFAAAAHLDPIESAVRATTELLHLLWSGPNLSPVYLEWVAMANTRDYPYLRPTGTTSPKIRRSCGSVHERLNCCLEKLHQSGFETGFVNLTRAELGVPVIRAIVPGLRHPWGRYAPGRLFEVPKRMGWINAGRTEHELNPVTCML